MHSVRGQFALRLLPSLTDLAFLAPLALLFGRLSGIKTLLEDCDTGWHIRTGQWILANHAAPARDIFSYSRPGAPWYAWEWLSDVVWARLDGWGGLQLVVLATLLLICATFTGLYLLARRKANPVVALLVTLMAAQAASVHWLARPHMFTLLFVVLFYAALEQVRAGRTRIAGVPILAALPVVTVLWTNLHGGFFVGAVMLAAYGAGEYLRLLLATPAGDAGAIRRAGRNYLLSAAACLAASLINPYTWHLHAHMLQYLSNPWNGEHIVEFFSPDFHHPAALFFEVLLALGLASAVAQVRRGNFTEPLLIVAWAHGALLAGRNIPIYVILAAPPVAAAVQGFLQALPQMQVAAWIRRAAAQCNAVLERTAETDRLPRLHLVSLAGAAVIVALVYAPHPPKKFRAQFDPGFYPAKAIETLRADAGARIFTDDEWGDYLIWTLYPNHRVFVDGRSDFYGNAFEKQYGDVMTVKYDWEQILSRYGVNTILLPPAAPLVGALKESSRWRVAYDDGIALVFRAVTPQRGEQVSVAAGLRGGDGRDREVTKTLEERDRAITTTIKPTKKT